MDKGTLLQLDLAIVPIITTVLVTLGSTLFAISIGLELTLPAEVKEMIRQVMAQNVQYNVVGQAIDNYITLLAGIGAILIVAGIVYGSAKIAGIKRRMKSAKEVTNV
jgi:hypothetical protein